MVKKKVSKSNKKSGMRAGKIKGLTLQFIPFSEIHHLDSGERIRKILNVILGNRIIVLQGRLRPEEETRLIEDTMAMIGHVKGFKGIELAVIGANNNVSFFGRMALGMAKALAGDTSAMTIIGPASIVKEIKRDPRKIELMFKK